MPGRPNKIFGCTGKYPDVTKSLRVNGNDQKKMTVYAPIFLIGYLPPFVYVRPR